MIESSLGGLDQNWLDQDGSDDRHDKELITAVEEAPAWAQGEQRELSAAAAGQRWVGVGLAGQQGVGIGAGAMGLVAEHDAAEIPLGALPASFGLTESQIRPAGRGLEIVPAVDSLQRGRESAQTCRSEASSSCSGGTEAGTLRRRAGKSRD